MTAKATRGQSPESHKSHKSDQITARQIIEFVRKNAGRPLKALELSRSMNIEPDLYRGFRNTIKRLLTSGELVTLKRGRIGLPEQLDVLIGQVSVTRAGTGFLIREGDEEDILIAPESLSTALDGDRVMVRREGLSRGRESGTVIKILERSRKTIVGVLHKTKHFYIVTPDDQRLHRDIYIPSGETLSANTGQKVVVDLADWDDPYRNPEGKITEILGEPGDPRVDMLAIIRSYGLTEEFPREVERQARSARDFLSAAEIARREDFRDHKIYTIDPVDAKDHDDAISVEKTKTGYRLGVHIADVSFFVREDTLLDKEAYQRGTSVYLPGKVIPMLPEGISNDICSLRENEDRLAHSIIIEYDKNGKALDWEIKETVMRSCAKLSYEDAQSVFDGSPATDSARELEEELQLALELSRKISKRRFDSGSLDFDLPESRIELDDSGVVVSLSVQVRLEAHRLIEEFMLEANKAVALTFSRLSLATLFRVHDKPDLEKLTAFAELASAFGYKFQVSETISPRLVQSFLRQLEGQPEEEYLQELALRSMKKAVYQPENIGHFGLAFKQYTHFTSPIRRYPDLLIHRLLKSIKNQKYSHELTRKLQSNLGGWGNHYSETERAAERAEREAVKMIHATYLARHIGDEFDGIISGVVARGFFVRLADVHSEGMVRVSSIDDDFYRIDAESHALKGSRTGRVFRLGDRVRVRILQVDVERREVNLTLVETSDKPRRQRKRSPALEKSAAPKTTGGKGSRKKSSKPQSTKRRIPRKRKKQR